MSSADRIVEGLFVIVRCLSGPGCGVVGLRLSSSSSVGSLLICSTIFLLGVSFSLSGIMFIVFRDVLLLSPPFGLLSAARATGGGLLLLLELCNLQHAT